MSMTPEELRQRLSAIEPDDDTYAGIGPSDVDGLLALLEEDEAWLAARAVHALSRIDSDQARVALLSAAQSSRPEVRIAAARAAERLPSHVSDQILSDLLSDTDPGVRKFAIKSTGDNNSRDVRRRVAELASTDAVPELRAVALEKTRTTPP